MSLKLSLETWKGYLKLYDSKARVSASSSFSPPSTLSSHTLSLSFCFAFEWLAAHWTVSSECWYRASQVLTSSCIMSWQNTHLSQSDGLHVCEKVLCYAYQLAYDDGQWCYCWGCVFFVSNMIAEWLMTVGHLCPLAQPFLLLIFLFRRWGSMVYSRKLGLQAQLRNSTLPTSSLLNSSSQSVPSLTNGYVIHLSLQHRFQIPIPSIIYIRGIGIIIQPAFWLYRLWLMAALARWIKVISIQFGLPIDMFI